MRHVRTRSLVSLSASLALACAGGLPLGCAGSAQSSAHGDGGTPITPEPGQTSFASAPMLGTWQSYVGGGATSGGAGDASAAPIAAPVNGGATGASSASSSTPRTVQETDLYAVEGTRLYYLNSYRGLMVFDISNADAPKFLGRHAIFGDPQTMFVKDGVAVVVVGDWYGNDAFGVPFHGSVVRGLNANDPTNITTVGEVQVPGYVQDTRVVGNVLYAISVDYGWTYGFYNGYGYGGGGVAVPAGGGGGAPSSSASIVSINFAGGTVAKADSKTFSGDAVVFNVTPNAVMLAVSNQGATGNVWTTGLTYVDITDAAGAITTRGTATIPGNLSTWSADNGRWNLDFADGQTAHALTQLPYTLDDAGEYTNGYQLSTVSFSTPSSPLIESQIPIKLPSDFYYATPTAIFDGARLYISPSSYYSSSPDAGEPLEVYDLTNPASPSLVSEMEIPGNVWLFKTDGDRIFSLGNTYGSNSSNVTVNDIDITNPSNPTLLGTASFGNGWAWTPAASTFKAFTIDDAVGFAVVPFSSWGYTTNSYTNGVELVQYTDAGIQGCATASTKGYVQRGIFVGSRLYSMSDLALAVIDYSDPSNPVVTNEVTLARNVINAAPQGTTIAELDSDWWGNDVTSTDMRVLPIASAAETTDEGPVPTASIKGVGAQSFQNGTLTYVVTYVDAQVPCGPWSGSPSDGGGLCKGWTQRVTVVDTSNGGAAVRGTVDLPAVPTGWAEGGWFGFYWYDWYSGGDVVQVGNDALAFSRWYPQWAPYENGYYEYVDSLDALFVVDLSNPDAPKLASTKIIDDTTEWWGNMLAVANELYTTHFEWVERPDPSSPYGTQYYVRYFLDQIDLSDRANPKVGKKINVPGILVGGSASSPNTLYTVDYHWNADGNPVNMLQAVEVNGSKATLLSSTLLDGWVGNVIVQNDVAYMTVQQYDWEPVLDGYGTWFTELHQIDFTNPAQPRDFVATDPKIGFGWLLAVDGDRALITSGWGNTGIDIYKLSSNAAPVFDQFARTLGWGANAATRQANTIYLSSGYWGVEPIVLK